MFPVHRTSISMNYKLNNELGGSSALLPVKKPVSSIKEERRRTGRYIAILVGIALFLLALYHAWVRRIPIVASLVIPALIMFIYVGWVLYTASKDKHRLQDAEAALQAMNAASLEGNDNEATSFELVPNNVSVASSKASSKSNSPIPTHKEWKEKELPIVLIKKGTDIPVKIQERNLITPVILVNDKPHEDPDQKWAEIVEKLISADKYKAFHTRKKLKRRFCRSKRNAVFKRSYSIA